MMLTDFLLARIAEREALVSELDDEAWEQEFGAWSFNGTEEPLLSAVMAVKPSVVLAECEAKRKIVRLALDAFYHTIEQLPKDYMSATLHTLAAPYSDHPDFNPDWLA